MIHKLAHLFGKNYGYVETFYWGGDMIVCFRCAKCGLLQDFSLAQKPY